MPVSPSAGFGVAVFSVAMCGAGPSAASDDRRARAAAAEHLLALERLAVPATLALSDPVQARLADRLSVSGRHEVALLADPSWSAPPLRRPKLAAGLSRQIGRASAGGYWIRTLIATHGGFDEHADLFVKLGISAIGTAPRAAVRTSLPSLAIFPRLLGQRPARTRAVRAIRFGLWELSADGQLPGESAAVLARRMDRASATGELLHVAIDLAELADAGPRGMRRIERLLAHAVRRRAAGALSIETLGQTAARLSRPRLAAPARSILRPQAA